MPISLRFYAQRDSLEAHSTSARRLQLARQRYDAGSLRGRAQQVEARIPQTRADLASTDEAILLDQARRWPR